MKFPAGQECRSSGGHVKVSQLVSRATHTHVVCCSRRQHIARVCASLGNQGRRDRRLVSMLTGHILREEYHGPCECVPTLAATGPWALMAVGEQRLGKPHAGCCHSLSHDEGRKFLPINLEESSVNQRPVAGKIRGCWRKWPPVSLFDPSRHTA